MKVNSVIKWGYGIALAGITLATQPIMSQNKITKDTFSREVPIYGTSNETILNTAPNPNFLIRGVLKKAKFVIDVDKNILYSYNDGVPQNAYLVALGKKKTPTKRGYYIISHVESYPYRTAPKTTKRHRQPKAFGPKAIITMKLDPETGNKTPTGQFIHGNNNINSLGKYASGGCIRMDNEVIKKISKEVNRGDLIFIK